MNFILSIMLFLHTCIYPGNILDELRTRADFAKIKGQNLILTTSKYIMLVLNDLFNQFFPYEHVRRR